MVSLIRRWILCNSEKRTAQRSREDIELRWFWHSHKCKWKLLKLCMGWYGVTECPNKLYIFVCDGVFVIDLIPSGPYLFSTVPLYFPCNVKPCCFFSRVHKSNANFSLFHLMTMSSSKCLSFRTLKSSILSNCIMFSGMSTRWEQSF